MAVLSNQYFENGDEAIVFLCPLKINTFLAIRQSRKSNRGVISESVIGKRKLCATIFGSE